MKRIVVGVGGASGSPYAHRLLSALHERDDVDVDLVMTRAGRQVWDHEVGEDPERLADRVHAHHDMSAPIASGSVQHDGMVVVPCSGGSLGRIAHGLSTDLLGRAADVCLKERRPLILVLRESPYSAIHCENMLKVTRAGAVVLPASPNFYGASDSVGDLVDTVVARVLDHLKIEHAIGNRWNGELQRGVR